MSEVKAFFRFCPSCGKRFHVRLVKHELVSVEREQAVEEKAVLPVSEQIVGFTAPVPVVLEEGRPAVVDIEEFRYTYRCKHCGHEWTEEKVEEKEER